jgi:2-aminoadipate transaminase
LKDSKNGQRNTPKLIYVMPNFQNPTGVSYTRQKKEEIIALSEKYDFMILEDDYLNELSFTKEPATPMKSLDRHDRVIYIKSFSKMFMPGLRLGYLIVPDAVSNKIRAAKQSTDISTFRPAAACTGAIPEPGGLGAELNDVDC